MQSDYVSAFGIGGLIGPDVRQSAIRAIDEDEDEMAGSSRSRPIQLSSKSSTMIASAVTPAKRNRFNSVETPPTTNTSSSSTDTVTPLHGLASKAAAAVLKRSHSIKHAAQAKRKTTLRSLSHTMTPSHHEDQYELENLKIKYESFCNGEEDDDDRDADVEDADEADENESLLHDMGPVVVTASPKDVNNNSNVSNNSSPHNDDQSLKVVIVNNGATVAASKAKRVESIRMRHHSSLGGSSLHVGNNDAASSSSSSRLKYFKCRKNKVRSKASQRRHNYLVIFLLFVVNLLNYIDRYTLAGT